MEGRSNAASTLRDMVVQRVRASIISGRTPPGALFSVPTLAVEIGISTTPVREALLELARSSMVTPVRNRGFRVEPTSLEALQDLFTVRDLLECFAITALARKRPSDVKQLRKYATAVEEAVRHEDVLQYMEADRMFHQELVVQAGNPLLTRLVMDARDGMRLYGTDTRAGRDRQRASVGEHYRLVDLAEAGDKRNAAKLMSHHISAWKPIFIEATKCPGGIL